ncbi:SLBB domain-containing protein [Sphingobium sp.]|uniref:SLBB domain-containing protein n=1 Tax=Sphingobium sp. TaxID=1912891 RepID=UPI002627DC28|nr:SLBB domain-containing protein [Sphingobium sp.]|tara:strand:- start:7180 stop:9165 length:1986 start_codon:yes stop_codon:yes gene_type:complete
MMLTIPCGDTGRTGVLHRGAISLCALAMILASSPATAQVSNPNIPSGSPVDPYAAARATRGNGPNSRGDNGSNSPTTQQPSEPYQPVMVGNAGRDQDGTDVSMAGFRPRTDENGLLDVDSLRLKKPAAPGEFETWVEGVTGRRIKRFGSDLLMASARDFAVPAQTTIPPDYALNVGDMVSISLTGSVEGSVDLEIDRDGNIFLPNVGAVNLVGVRYRDLKDRIAAAIGRQYRGYDVSVSIKKLRGVRVYVTGFANNPGAYSVTSLSTLVNAVLAAGGPSSGGSFRSVKLYRNGAEVADFDLYELLRKGDRSLDPLVQNEDVLFIPPVGRQVAVIGSVNEEAIYEARPGESLADVLALAGGVTSLADPSRLILYRIGDQDTVGSRQIDRSLAVAEGAEAGDIIQVLPQGTLTRPLERQQAVVRIEGEVNRPGNYFVPPNTPLETVIEMAGGLTPRAYVYGTRFFRESVRAQQRRSFLEAIDQLEVSVAAAPLTGDSIVDAGERQSQIAAARAFLDQLRAKEPDGRLVMDIAPNGSSLPNNLPLENSDRIVVPPRIETVGVFGAVYRPASFLLMNGKTLRVKDYIEKSGGAIRGADKSNIFVVRANGSVLTRDRGALNARVMAGDTVFVPIKTQSSSVWAKIRDISTILFQFGLTAAAIAAIN